MQAEETPSNPRKTPKLLRQLRYRHWRGQQQTGQTQRRIWERGRNGCGKWETGSCYSVGHSSPGQPARLPIKRGHLQTKGQREAKKCNQLWLDVTTSHAPRRKGGIVTTTPPPSWATAPCPAVRRLRPKVFIATADGSVTSLPALLSGLRWK